MSKISLEMLTDIEKNTVDFMSNYDDRLKEPKTLVQASVSPFTVDAKYFCPSNHKPQRLSPSDAIVILP